MADSGNSGNGNGQAVRTQASRMHVPVPDRHALRGGPRRGRHRNYGRHRPWTSAEEELLRANIGQSLKELARRTGRSPQAIRMRRRKMSLAADLRRMGAESFVQGLLFGMVLGGGLATYLSSLA